MPIFENDARIIDTARDLETINAAVQADLRILLLPCNPNPPFEYTVSVFQHKTKGTYRLDLDPRLRYRNPQEHQQWRHALSLNYYPPLFKNAFAAYLIPADLKPGERVWLDDLIEDLLGSISGQGLGRIRLKSAYARWTGRAFEIEYDKEKVKLTIG